MMGESPAQGRGEQPRRPIARSSAQADPCLLTTSK